LLLVSRRDITSRLGVPEGTLRLWERNRLLPTLDDSNHDAYAARALLITAGRAHRMSLQMIREILTIEEKEGKPSRFKAMISR